MYNSVNSASVISAVSTMTYSNLFCSESYLRVDSTKVRSALTFDSLLLRYNVAFRGMLHPHPS